MPGANRLDWRKALAPCAVLLLTWIVCLLAPLSPASAAECTGGPIAPASIKSGGGGSQQPAQDDLVIKGACTMAPGDYYYGKVNIVGNASITFVDSPGNINFWATAIIIENNGAMMAGSPTVPFGKSGGTLTITLYGKDLSNGDPMMHPAQGAQCVTPEDPDNANVALRTGPCGIKLSTWDDNGTNEITDLPSGKDFFYQYGPLMGETVAGQTGQILPAKPPSRPNPVNVVRPGYFGNKALALSYGATLSLIGIKGTAGAKTADGTPSSSGTSWVRLAGDLSPPDAKSTDTTQIAKLSTSVKNDWQVGDHVVITTTDYIPTHSEEVTITAVGDGTITFSPPVKYPHRGTLYDLKTKLGAAAGRLGFDPVLTTTGAELRAAVALLTHSIRIVSGGDEAGVLFECVKPGDKCAPANYYYGGQVIFRQGFKQLQIQGVEFKQLGQGGRMMHYAVHFHKVRNPPANTYIKDSSVNESMSRWIVLHATNSVTLARNVGYKSIGHGYYLEAGTETDNKFYSNIGIDARGAVYSDDNPRKVPGIFAANNMAGDAFPYISDVNHPSVFWITNGWNDFIGNMAVGAGTCGSCYWFIASANNDFVDVQPALEPPPKYKPLRMKWKGYSALQGRTDVNGNPISKGLTPLKSFFKNYCSSAMNSFISIVNTASCDGMAASSPTPVPNRVTAIPSIAPNFDNNSVDSLTYYPIVTDLHFPTHCDPNSETSDTACAKAIPCAFGNPITCDVTVLDHYTSSFTWAHFNFSALWLRSGWYLLDNSVITDVQNAGVTMVSGGDYLRSSVPIGYWALTSHVAFIGETQPGGKYTSAKGPFNNGIGDLTCVNLTEACVNTQLGLPMVLSNFGTNQRFYNIYDGPTYEDANAFIDITTSPCTDDATCMYWKTPGVRLGPSGGYLPNAAIGWKQSNGFYYPPAFHSNNLYFNNVDIRHYVIEPFFLPGTYLTDTVTVAKNYTSSAATSANVFGNFTDVDRQTVLNDNDGTLTGLKAKPVMVGTQTLVPNIETISVNKDSFFNAPVETDQCRSNLNIDPGAACTVPQDPPAVPRATAKTSPYEYVTTVIYPECAGPDAVPGKCGSATSEAFTFQTDPDDKSIQYKRYTSAIDQGGDWSKACGGPYCYGVPIYRQSLLGDNTSGKETEEWKIWSSAPDCNLAANQKLAKCKFPFARMAGTGNYQRSVMTASGGTYYLDTTISPKVQKADEALGLKSDRKSTYVECDQKPIGSCQPRSINVFQGGKKYYVFFVYAKGTTKQVYQMYVGDGFTNLDDVFPIRMTIDPPYHVKEKFKTWDQTGWKRELIPGPDGKRNILQVTIDMKAFADELDPKSTTNDNFVCKPQNFCAVNGNSCKCNMPSNDPRKAANPALQTTCNNVCAAWGRKDLDCPKDGCLGFGFKLPQNFPGNSGYDTYHRPKPGIFDKQKEPRWTALLTRTDKSPDNAPPAVSYKKSSCYYPKVPGTDCPVPFKP